MLVVACDDDQIESIISGLTVEIMPATESRVKIDPSNFGIDWLGLDRIRRRRGYRRGWNDA